MGTGSEINSEHPIVLYDGVCNFCNSSVNFIIKHERDSTLRFASLQSELGKQITGTNGGSDDFDSIVFYHQKNISKRSRAAFQIAEHLKYPWRMVLLFRILPTFFTDFFYNLVAKNRYKIFGRSDACQIPTPELRKRFLDV